MIYKENKLCLMLILVTTLFTNSVVASSNRRDTSYDRLIIAVNNVRAAIIESTQSMQNFFTQLENARIERERQLMEFEMERAPGDRNSEVNELFSNLQNINQEVYDVVKQKEILDINYGLYMTPRAENDFINNAPYANIINKHKELFCSPNSGVENQVWQGICPEDNSVEVQHADIKISNLINTDSYTEAQRILADEILRNIIAPIPDEELRLIMTDENLVKKSNKEKYALALLRQAMLAPARDALHKSYAARATSKMQTMANEANRRIDNSDWTKNVNESSKTSLLRELVHIQAYNLWMQHEAYKQQERIELLLAAQHSYMSMRDKIFFDGIDEILASAGGAGSLKQSIKYSLPTNTEGLGGGTGNSAFDELLNELGTGEGQSGSSGSSNNVNNLEDLVDGDILEQLNQ